MDTAEDQKLKESEELVHTLVEMSLDATTTTDLSGNITFASKQTALLHGYETPDELVGKSAMILIAPEDHDRAKENLQKTAQLGVTQNCEYTFLKKDGTRFNACLSAALVKDADGRPKGFIATTRDITVQKNIDVQNKEKEDKYRTILENITDAVFVFDVHDTILYVSPSVTNIFGYLPEEMLGKHGRDFIHVQSAGDIIKAFAGVVVHPQDIHTLILQLKHKDGVWRMIEARGKGIKDKAGTIQAVVIVHDITSQKKSEEELQKRTKDLELMNQAMVGRELKMAVLKKEIETLKAKLSGMSL
jgi:PAS domain S-box-containing protein